MQASWAVPLPGVLAELHPTHEEHQLFDPYVNQVLELTGVLLCSLVQEYRFPGIQLRGLRRPGPESLMAGGEVRSRGSLTPGLCGKGSLLPMMFHSLGTGTIPGDIWLPP